MNLLRPNPGNGRQRMLQLQLLALLPVSIAALVNTGYQYLVAVAQDSTFSTDDFRSRLARGLGANHESLGLYDMLAAGFAHLVPILALALLVGGFWERIIAERRHTPMQPGFILVALLFTLLLPGAAAFGHVVFGMS
ncbi:MAG: RnfABCDGE type electron transport complex subunit D, partial [Gammaproteobacteria bacterium]|nr:RnfABCDGE type electron transport complex subunit D [Gammaproteobacteria bacterium]